MITGIERAVLHGLIMFGQFMVTIDQVKKAEKLLKKLGLYRNVQYRKTVVPSGGGSFTVDMVKYEIIRDN